MSNVTITVEFSTDGDDFASQLAWRTASGLAREILHDQVSRGLSDGRTNGLLKDLNGNTVGSWRLTVDEGGDDDAS